MTSEPRKPDAIAPGEPLTPADSDLSDFPFMPLEVGRLRRSKAWVKAKRNPALGFYMINLWTAAWHDKPAGSLEDDDDVLADAAMCEPSKWAKVRDDALRGWVKGADGRLYNPTVCEKAREAWAAKQERREKNEHERDRKRLEREEKADLFAVLKAAGVHKPWNTSLTDLRAAVQDLSAGQVPDGPKPVHDLSRLREGQGQGEGQREGQGDSSSVPTGTGAAGAATPAPVPSPAAPMSALEAVAIMARTEGAPLTDEDEKLLWAGGRALFALSNISADNAGKFVGKLIKDNGGDRVLVFDVMRAACLERPIDPRGWMTATCQSRRGKRIPAANKQTALEDSNLAAAAEFANGS